MHLLPRSLFGRLMLVLATGLIIAQLLSTAINLQERDSLLVRASGMQPAQRIADIVTLLDSFPPGERNRIVAILNAPPLTVSLERPPESDKSETTGGPHAAMFSAVLRAALGDDRPVRVTMRGPPPPGMTEATRPHGPFPMARPMGPPAMHRAVSHGMSFMAQVRLQDGTWATFDTQITPESASLPWRLLLTLATLLAVVLIVSYVAVRWVTRPLHVLASAADELGRDINRPPLPESGPAEVSRAARAFNNMQAHLIHFIEERTRILAAISHDLKTPITRMRLRAEMLDDDNLRAKFESDLLEMQTMVTQALDFMRGLSNVEPEQLVDVMALLETLQSDNEAMGRKVSIAGRVTQPLRAAPQLIKRCIANLIDNAVLYGKEAEIHAEETGTELTLRIRDHGLGMPSKELERVFEPFYRLEASRNRETGGTGLGLSIARNIARAHGGDVRLRNHEHGGLEAIVTLPSCSVSESNRVDLDHVPEARFASK
jgi:signal transduction histidine kinase